MPTETVAAYSAAFKIHQKPSVGAGLKIDSRECKSEAERTPVSSIVMLLVDNYEF